MSSAPCASFEPGRPARRAVNGRGSCPAGHAVLLHAADHETTERSAVGLELLLLDVDGVISPLGRSTAWDDFRIVDAAPAALQVSRQMGDALAALPAQRRWLTSWDDHANAWVGPALGWKPLPVVRWPGGPGARPHKLKIEGFESLLRSLQVRPRAVAWCDDALTPPMVRRARRLLGTVPLWTAVPEPLVGLTAEHVAECGAFLAGRR